MNGFLSKLGHVRKNWKVRYFVIKYDEARYYKDEKLKGKLSLKTCKVEDLPNGSHGKDNTFLVKQEKNKSFILSAASPKEKNQWMKAFTFVANQLAIASPRISEIDLSNPSTNQSVNRNSKPVEEKVPTLSKQESKEKIEQSPKNISEKKEETTPIETNEPKMNSSSSYQSENKESKLRKTLDEDPIFNINRIEKSGWLEKRDTHHLEESSAWNKRKFLVLEKGKMVEKIRCFSNEDKTLEKGSIFIKRSLINKIGLQKARACFLLHATSSKGKKKEYYFGASSEQDCNEWMEAISAAVRALEMEESQNS